MSFVLRDPFFDGFEDLMSTGWPFSSVRSYPFAVEDKKNDELDNPKRLRRDVITPFSGFGRMDMQEKEKEYELSVDIPGMNKDDIKITTENNMLVIEGERKQETREDDKKKKYHFMERHYGSFRRELSVPANANTDKICATYENGVLKVAIPKMELPVNKKQIEIK